MKYIILIFAILVFGSSSCKKDVRVTQETVDTLFPKPYLPIYPGSWWQYINLSDSSTHTESAGPYVLASANYHNVYHSDNFWVPTWNGVPHFGYGFNTTFCTGTSYESKEFTFELKEEDLGYMWLYQGGCQDSRYPTWDIDLFVDSINLTKQVGDTTYTNVIKIVHYSEAAPNSVFYFAKDVGLIEKCEYGGLYLGNPTTIFQLQNYHINN